MEALAATWKSTRVCSFLSVDLTMLGEVRGLRELFAADVALEGLLFGVGSLVNCWSALECVL
jgi:hypothetical protein